MRIELKDDSSSALLSAGLWWLFFWIACGLGYAVLNRYQPLSLTALSDSAYYAKVVEHGFAAVSSDVRTMRLLLPMLAHGIYLLLPAKLGSWNTISLSMLLVNAAFTASIALLTFRLGLYTLRHSGTALIASCLFLLNFCVINFFLTGLIESGFAFFLLCLPYVLLFKNEKCLMPLAILGCMTKEVYFPIGAVFLCSWFFYDYIKTKKINRALAVNIFLFIFFALATVIFLRIWATGYLIKPWNYIPGSLEHSQYQGMNLFLTLGRFFYVFIWLLPLSILGFKIIPEIWRFALLVSGLVTLMMVWWVGASGAGIGRLIFDLAGAPLSIAAAYALIKLVNIMEVVREV